ncbi:MAG: hypothetical protein RLY93_08740 [Sumerlaeia bacterium]
MYLHKLEKDEKTTFLAFAEHLAEIDDQSVDARERYLIRYMCSEMGLDPDEALEAKPAYDRDRLLKVFHRPEARRVLVLEGVGIAFSNGAMDEEQRKELTSLAEAFQLCEKFVAKAEAVVQKQLEVMKEFDELIG